MRDISTKPGSISPDEWSNIQWALVGSGLEHLNEIAKLVRKSEKLILATDPDREGEAISWHIQEELKVTVFQIIVYLQALSLNPVLCLTSTNCMHGTG